MTDIVMNAMGKFTLACVRFLSRVSLLGNLVFLSVPDFQYTFLYDIKMLLQYRFFVSLFSYELYYSSIGIQNIHLLLDY